MYIEPLLDYRIGFYMKINQGHYIIKNLDFLFLTRGKLSLDVSNYKILLRKMLYKLLNKRTSLKTRRLR